MNTYQLQIKQLVDYPRCRIYREFIRKLMNDKNLRKNGGSYFFALLVLYSFANFRSSYRRMDGISYLIGPGEWIFSLKELQGYFRLKYQHQTIDVLKVLQDHHFMEFTLMKRKNLVKVVIPDWKKNNSVLGYHAPCQKDTGFFFFPVASVSELISMERCSELDIVLDLWLNTVYYDERVKGSEKGSVVYFRNNTGNPVISYTDLSERWGISRAGVSRLLKKLQELGYITLCTFSGNQGSAIYLNGYLSTMFQISDVPIDKEEIAFTLKVKLRNEEIPSVSKESSRVSKLYIRIIISKLAQTLSVRGFSCFQCLNLSYKLYSYLTCVGEIDYILEVYCNRSGKLWFWEFYRE